MKGAYLGPEYSNNRIEEDLNHCGAVFRKLSDEELIEETVAALADEKAIGWMQGRMEFGPRALGARSIIADPRHLLCKNNLILKLNFVRVLGHLRQVYPSQSLNGFQIVIVHICY